MKMSFLDKVTNIVASQIWRMSERSGIWLGRFAPHVFGAMISSKAKKQTKQ